MAKTNKLPAGWTYSNWNNMYWRGAYAVVSTMGGWVVYLDRHARHPFTSKNRLPDTFATPLLAMAAADALV